MEDLDVLLVRKTKQIWNDYEVDIEAAVVRRDGRLEKIKALAKVQRAVQMMVDCVQRCSR